MEILNSYDISNFLQRQTIDITKFVRVLDQLVITKNLYANLLKNNGEDAVDLFVLSDGNGTLKICAQTDKVQEKQIDMEMQSEPDIVKMQLKKCELQLQDDYNNYVRQMDCGKKPVFKPAFKQAMTCIKNLDSPSRLPLGNEAIDLPDYDHTIVAKPRLLAEPPLESKGIAESFQLNDLTFIINPDPINGQYFEKIRVKANVETSFHVIEGRCNGLGVHGSYRLERVGSTFLLLDFEFTQPDLFSQP